MKLPTEKGNGFLLSLKRQQVCHESIPERVCALRFISQEKSDSRHCFTLPLSLLLFLHVGFSRLKKICTVLWLLEREVRKEERAANDNAYTNATADPSFSKDSNWFFNNFKSLINVYTQTQIHANTHIYSYTQSIFSSSFTGFVCLSICRYICVCHDDNANIGGWLSENFSLLFSFSR